MWPVLPSLPQPEHCMFLHTMDHLTSECSNTDHVHSRLMKRMASPTLPLLAMPRLGRPSTPFLSPFLFAQRFYGGLISYFRYTQYGPLMIFPVLSGDDSKPRRIPNFPLPSLVTTADGLSHFQTNTCLLKRWLKKNLYTSR